MRVPERAGEEIAEARVEDFQREHGFPVADCEADAVCVDGDDAGVELFLSVFFSFHFLSLWDGRGFMGGKLWEEWVGGMIAYLKLGIAT